MNIYLDLAVSCYGFLDAISFYTFCAGTLYVDLWESSQSSSNTYIIKHSFKLVALSEGLHSFVSVNKTYVRPGQMLGDHYEAGGIASYAFPENLEPSGYSESELSRILSENRHHDTLSVGTELTRQVGSIKRMPAIKLHVAKGKSLKCW